MARIYCSLREKKERRKKRGRGGGREREKERKERKIKTGKKICGKKKKWKKRKKKRKKGRKRYNKRMTRWDIINNALIPYFELVVLVLWRCVIKPNHPFR
jgi:hypothetical protein